MQTAKPIAIESITVAHQPNRVAAIDVLRALTMVLMIFVNDLWSLSGIPAWLEHVPPGADGIGLADVVFPAFLFIVGLSLPFAIGYRRQKGDNTSQLIGHVLTRSGALLLMGLFLVNGEYINEPATGMPRQVWNVLSCGCFILLWNTYPKQWPAWINYSLKALGISGLLVLAFLYRGGETDSVTRFETHWWGILGLIGWSYLAAAVVTVFAKNRLPVLVAAWAAFCLLSIANHTAILPEFLHHIPGAISGGTLAGLSLGGVVIGSLFQRFQPLGQNRQMTILFLSIAIVLIGLSMATRPYWGLSKLAETPAWLFLCSAFTLLAFTGIYWLADVYGKKNWFNFIKPAGTDTLLCYLVPYFAYALIPISPFTLHTLMLTGGIGLIKSFLFAVLCVWIAGFLSQLGLRLKL